MLTTIIGVEHQLGGSSEADVNIDLVVIEDATIVHQQSAVVMAEMALEASKCEQIRTLTCEIFNARESRYSCVADCSMRTRASMTNPFHDLTRNERFRTAP